MPQQDHIQLAAALEKLIKDPNTRKIMGKMGREYIVQRFSSSIINRETYGVYQNLW